MNINGLFRVNANEITNCRYFLLFTLAVKPSCVRLFKLKGLRT